MDREDLVGESERGIASDEESRSQTHESDNAWLFKSVPEEELHKWRTEKERYDEVIEYIREVDEILNLIKPFPRDERHTEVPARPDSRSQSSRYGLDHLENIIKLVQQLKELQEKSSKLGERTCYVKDLKKLREHKRRLKNEELEWRSRGRAKSTPEEFFDQCFVDRKCSSTSEKLECEPKEGWQEKRKSLSLENKSKVSKWTKVKEAFHWERTSALKESRKEALESAGEKGSRDHSPDDGSSALDGFSPPPPPPSPPPPPPPISSRSDDFLSVGPVQDFPSSSSSDRLDEFLTFSPIVSKGSKTDPESPTHPFGVDESEDVDPGRKSSIDEVMLSPQQLCKDDYKSGKANKTTWGKVKDIIQTRKDSLKKKPKKRGSDEFKKRRKLSTLSNPQFSDQFEDLSSPEEKIKNAEIIPKITYEFPEDSPEAVAEEKCSKRLTPALTVTLPSTEELRSFPFEDIEKKEGGEDHILGQFSCQAHYCEDKSKFGKGKSGQQRLSRWIKVKRVFLTSSSPPPQPQYLPVNNSSPTSQNKSSGFFSDLESDELSSGEWIEEKSPSQERQRLGYPTDSQSTSMALIQEDIRKSYNELQKKLSQEFDQKLKEWEIKNEAPPKQEESSPKAKVEEGDCIPKFRKTRDSITVPLPNLNDLSPEFKKKLNDWKKMKTSQSSSSVSSSATKEEFQGQNIKIRIGEWQPWKSRCSQKATEEFPKKPEGSRPPANRRKEEEGGSACSTTRRGSKRRDSVKKISQSRTSSGGESLLSISSTDKDGRFIRRSQKVKDFQWVEKELQKIEREKLRLEQEKEKYLEREARLEKMKRTMSTPQEVLVRTPEGFFRFKGISQKFTKKLYEWEKARGIAPEASTFALLEESARSRIIGDAESEGGVALQRSKSTGSVPELPSTLLIQSMAHHPSSLSLNDVDELKTRDEEESISSEHIKEEPEAIIVDVEDIIEETALMADGLDFKCERPVYTYAPEGVDSEERFYLSRGFNVRIMGEKEEKIAVKQDEERFLDIRQDKPVTYSDIEPQRLKSDDLHDNFNKNPEGEKTLEEEDTKKFQEVQDLRNTTPDDSMEVEASRGHFTSKFRDRKREQTATTESIQKFPLWADKPIHLYSDNSVSERTDPEVLKKKIKEKITLMQRMSTEASWKHSEYDYSEKVRSEEIGGDIKEEVRPESINVFVPTTRKIISPVKTTQGAMPSVCSYVIDDVKTDENYPRGILPNSKSASPILQTKKNEPEVVTKRDIGMPPLPNSPKIGKKLNPKETAPSIRMIIAKYNQKISEHDSAVEKRPESGSPIWRSPVFGRRTQEKIDKFLKREEGGKGSGEVQKSASLDNVRSQKSTTPPQEREIKGILKSSSVGVMKTRPLNQEPLGSTLSVETPEATKETSPSVLRAMKIQKAKEEFLSGRLGGSSDTSTTSTVETPPAQVRLAPAETEVEAEPEQNLIKSVSAETIGGESTSGEKALDRPFQKSSSKFDISSIKSRFRKIRMRKEKDPKMNAVAVLCRQSLFIEVPKTSEGLSLSKSCPSSPVMDRNKPPQPPPASKK